MSGQSYLVLLGCQAAGEIIHGVTGLPLSGPVIGMMLLLVWLSMRGGPSPELRASANGLLGYLSLLFVPAAVGIMPLLPLLRGQWLPIVVALVGSSVLGMASAALIVQSMNRIAASPRDEPVLVEQFEAAGGDE